MDFYGFWWWQSRFNRDRWFANSVNTLIHVSTVDHPLFEIVFQLAPGQIRFSSNLKVFFVLETILNWTHWRKFNFSRNRILD